MDQTHGDVGEPGLVFKVLAMRLAVALTLVSLDHGT